MTYDIHDAQRHFEKLIEAALRGEEVFIKDGAKIVQMVPIGTSNAKAASRGSADLNDDPTQPPQ